MAVPPRMITPMLHHWSSIEAEIPAHGLSSGGLGTLLKIII
jgi:hypothetical protein